MAVKKKYSVALMGLSLLFLLCASSALAVRPVAAERAPEYPEGEEDFPFSWPADRTAPRISVRVYWRKTAGPERDWHVLVSEKEDGYRTYRLRGDFEYNRELKLGIDVTDLEVYSRGMDKDSVTVSVKGGSTTELKATSSELDLYQMSTDWKKSVPKEKWKGFTLLVKVKARDTAGNRAETDWLRLVVEMGEAPSDGTDAEDKATERLKWMTENLKLGYVTTYDSSKESWAEYGKSRFRVYYVATKYDEGKHGSALLDDSETDHWEAYNKRTDNEYALRMFYFWSTKGEFRGWQYGSYAAYIIEDVAAYIFVLTEPGWVNPTPPDEIKASGTADFGGIYTSGHEWPKEESSSDSSPSTSPPDPDAGTPPDPGNGSGGGW